MGGTRNPPYLWINTLAQNYTDIFTNWTHRLWREKDIDELLEYYPKIEKIYRYEKALHGKADIARYLILYSYGGLYVDADSVWINNRTFDSLIFPHNYETLFSYVSKKYSDFWNNIITQTNNNFTDTTSINERINFFIAPEPKSKWLA